jgi:type I restriction enzyme S subunit
MKRGYKQTEVGVIPEDWELARLSALVATGPKNGYSGRSGKDARGTATLSLGATSSGCMLLNEETVKRLDETIDPRSDLFLKPGDVLVQLSNTPDLVGTTAVFDGPAEVYVYPDLMMRMRFRDDATAHWFWRYANSGGGRRFFLSVAAGSSGSMPKISGEKLRAMQLPLPPLPEQRSIATALSDVDGLLGALDRLIAKKRDLKQAAMQQLLTGQTRLPGFRGEWEVKTLGDVCQKIQDGTHFSPKLGGNDFLYVTSKNIRFGKLDLSTAERISAEEHSKIYTRCDVRKGDLLLTKDGANTGNAALNTLDEPFSLLSSVAMLRFDPRQHVAAYFMHQILSARGQIQLKEAMSGNAITRLTLQKIRALRFTTATLPEQTAIAEVLSDMDAELAGLKQRREKTRALKQGMMQELLTGRTRLI